MGIRTKTMHFKENSGWTACFDSAAGLYTAQIGGSGDYHLYELTKEQYDALGSEMTERVAYDVISKGRHLYMDINDRCGPPYTVVFDDDYKQLCPWADVVSSGACWPKELTDAAAAVFESEQPNR